MTIAIGCGQITWRNSGQTDDEVLADIRAAGYAGAPWPRRQGVGAVALKEQFARSGLKPAPGYYWADLWDIDRREEHLAEARRYAEISQELGLNELYLAAGGFDRLRPGHRTRRQAAGKVTADDSLSESEFQSLAEGVSAVARTTLEYGVRSCYHNHVGTFVETRAEVERLLSLADPEALFLGPDTGHLAWAGEDPVAFCRDHLDRIKTVHIKDIDPGARAEGKRLDWDYQAYSDGGIFTELGQGLVDWDGFFAVLREGAFSGWLIVETDVTQLPTARESAAVSRRNLARWGL
ncbi:MAG: sugar phosphate isomerase/epimerase family protein [Candidatus Dormibacteraceae bacterium]